jgi:RNA polymerase sigma-70 factor (ECF subfamily)
LIGIGERITGNKADGEDIAIETLTRAHLQWGKLRRADWRTGWVLRVAANQAIDLVRRGRLTADLQAPQMPDAVKPIDDRIILVAGLSRLPKRQREAVVLTYMCDLPQADVAHAMRISEGSVKTHLHRGINALRTILNFEGSEALYG